VQWLHDNKKQEGTMNKQLTNMTLAVLMAYSGGALAFTFENESVSGNFDSTVSVGIGIRAKNTSCGLVLKDTAGFFTGNPGPTGAGAPSGCTEAVSGLGDQGNLNYAKGDAFTTYLKGTHELLVKMPEDVKFMARASWLKDFSATRTTGYISAGNPSGASLPDEARDDLNFKARLLDLWVSKGFSIGEERARVRAGNQVISWGESLFLPGGINQTNALDLMRLSQPGTQLKEVFLPAPIVSFASGVGHGMNVEAYVQTNWNRNYFPPTGSYWSMVNGLGKGHDDYGLSEEKARNRGQYGAALRWQPKGTQLNLGAYAMAYHDKAPQFSYNIKDSGNVGWTYAEDRKLYGISANFPLGDWAIGTELSYRPKDAVSLNAATGCGGTNGNCYVDEKKFQWHLTGILSMTPGDYPFILKALGGASTATLLAEAVVVRYPNLKPSYNGELVGAGGWGWGLENDPAGTPESVGTKNSWGYNFDFSWVYDGTVIPGWQVIPEIYYFQAVKGRTPNAMATFMEGAKSVNFIVNFVQNPASWQIGVNYAKFWGGKRVFDQPYKDRDFFGAFVSRNF
jgi:hypothetical protein